MHQKFMIYSLIYGVIFAMAILGLIFNIKSIGVNERSNYLQIEVQKLIQENQDLSLQVQENGRLGLLEIQANNLNYHLPRTITYVSVNGS